MPDKILSNILSGFMILNLSPRDIDTAFLDRKKKCRLNTGININILTPDSKRSGLYQILKLTLRILNIIHQSSSLIYKAAISEVVNIDDNISINW